ncbi:DUF1697 domain-containing protein [Sphingobacterium hungaricum]
MLKTYIIFLRGVNVSGKNLLKMADLQKALSDAGFEHVKTYIQSGNILLDSIYSKTEIANRFAQLLEDKFQIKVPLFIYTTEELKKISHENPFKKDLEPNKVFLAFLEARPLDELAKKLDAINHGEEQYVLRDKVLYFYLPEGMGKAKLTVNYFEKKLAVLGTARNLNTIEKILSLSAD